MSKLNRRSGSDSCSFQSGNQKQQGQNFKEALRLSTNYEKQPLKIDDSHITFIIQNVIALKNKISFKTSETDIVFTYPQVIINILQQFSFAFKNL